MKNNVVTPSGISLHYEDAGRKSAPAIILIMGLGAQMTAWPDELYYGLVNKGFRVIRFDNRDVGKSSHLNHHQAPNIVKTWLSRKFSLPVKTPYNLDDMADDVLAIMKARKIKKAHIVGASMGGMIAQILAAKHKKRVLSLVSIMSSSHAPFISKENLALLIKLAKFQQNTPEAAIEYNIKLNQLISSKTHLPDIDTLRNKALNHVRRGHNPQGVKRQLAAMTASGCRKHLNTKIKVPTLVIHGANDPVISVNKGQETAQHIKKAKLKVIEDMAHDFPLPLMKKLTKQITKHVKKAERKRQQKLVKKQTSLTPINQH
ncbi:alpha/beta fold hydrolase [Thalassotalea marina]|uniref:Alpha/beta hydrolase n=1 Tax=Thalassotalea marina TaxID=1673741 RepID=A0A919EN64_9GAMM|nr:alpha/beta hydrolase [Thalassotalea marina]GHG01408.1 alpha/beta hydrolase [Thalassotalea marina]